MLMEILSITQGTAETWRVDLLDSAGVAAAFDAGDALTCDIWSGDDTAVLANPTATWVDAPNGRFNVTITAAQSADLPASRLYIRVTVTPPGYDPVEGWRAFLDVAASPGSATELTSYCTLDDMRTYAPAVLDLMTETDRSGFAEARHVARQRIDQLIQAHWRQDSWHTWSPLYGPATDGYSKWLQDQLDADVLMVLPQVTKLAALWSIAAVYDSALTGDKSDGEYRKLAREFEYRANQLAKSAIFQLDFNGDGYPDTSVRAGVADTRY